VTASKEPKRRPIILGDAGMPERNPCVPPPANPPAKGGAVQWPRSSEDDETRR
jgi:hypothetical protein